MTVSDAVEGKVVAVGGTVTINAGVGTNVVATGGQWSSERKQRSRGMPCYREDT